MLVELISEYWWIIPITITLAITINFTVKKYYSNKTVNKAFLGGKANQNNGSGNQNNGSGNMNIGDQ